MIAASAPWGVWAATTGEDATGRPTDVELAEHFERVYGGSCDHPAAELNGRLELIFCDRCRR